MISRSNISKELTPNLGNAKRRSNMAKMSRVGLYPAEEKRSGTYSQAKRKKNMKAGGMTQGYKAREDESLGMRTGPERSKSQSMAARRDESYGDWGKRKRGRINMSSGGIALRGHGCEVR